MYHSALIREAASCSRWELTQRPISTGQRAESKRVLNGMSSSNPSPQGQGSLQKRKWKDHQRWQMTPRKYQCIRELTEMTTACSRLHRSKPDQVPALRRGRGHDIPPLTKKLFATDSCWERDHSFSSISDTGCINHTPRKSV